MQQDLLRIVLLGLTSGFLYAVIYFTQQAIFLNGLFLNFKGALNQGDLANGFRLVLQVSCYCSATIALFALYLWLLVLCRRRQFHNRKTLALAITFPVLFNLGLLFGKPHLSIDLFNYMAYGYLGNLPSSNSYTNLAQHAINTPLGEKLVAFGWRPVHGISPYGPLWTQFEMMIMRLTEHVPTAMFLFKGVVIAASLGAAALIWAILGRVRPVDQLFGTLVYLWNPIIIVEFAAEGHNDALMIMFILAALLLNTYARSALSIAANLLGVLTKYLPLVFFPPLLINQWRTRRNNQSFILQIIFGMIFGLIFLIVLYKTPKSALEALKGLQTQTQPRSSILPSGLLFWCISHTHSSQESMQFFSRVWHGLIGISIMVASLKVRDSMSLFKAFAAISLILVLTSPVYWSWYVCMPLALIALSPSGFLFWIGFVLTFCSRLVAPLNSIFNNGFIPLWLAEEGKNLIGIMLPLVIFLLLYLWHFYHHSFLKSQKTVL
jgi:alpha-1,6-mannosyltransferase